MRALHLFLLLQTDAGVFLKHVREVRERKESGEEDPPAKITRLAIGVDGGFDASKEKYEYTVSQTFCLLSIEVI